MAGRPNNRTAIAAHIQGLREMKAAFQALPDIVRERMLSATETTVREIARNAQARILRSPSVRTRALHDHIKWSVTKTNGRGRVGVATGTTTMQVGGKKVRVKGIITAGRGGSASSASGAKSIQPTRYAHLIEFGTKHFPAEPFMVPSADAEKQHYLNRCKAAGPLIETDASRYL